MIDISREQPIPLAQASRLVPPVRKGRPVSPSTLWRWHSVGILSDAGERVRLEVCRIGGSQCTTAEALTRFFVRLSAAEPQTTTTTTGRDHERAERQLDRAGI